MDLRTTDNHLHDLDNDVSQIREKLEDLSKMDHNQAEVYNEFKDSVSSAIHRVYREQTDLKKQIGEIAQALGHHTMEYDRDIQDLSRRIDRDIERTSNNLALDLGGVRDILIAHRERVDQLIDQMVEKFADVGRESRLNKDMFENIDERLMRLERMVLNNPIKEADDFASSLQSFDTPSEEPADIVDILNDFYQNVSIRNEAAYNIARLVGNGNLDLQNRAYKIFYKMEDEDINALNQIIAQRISMERE